MTFQSRLQRAAERGKDHEQSENRRCAGHGEICHRQEGQVGRADVSPGPAGRQEGREVYVEACR